LALGRHLPFELSNAMGGENPAEPREDALIVLGFFLAFEVKGRVGNQKRLLLLLFLACQSLCFFLFFFFSFSNGPLDQGILGDLLFFFSGGLEVVVYRYWFWFWFWF